jgi:hypothetical protein
MFSGRFFSARRAPSSASSISGAANAAKAQKEGVLKGPILEDAEFWITRVYDSHILRDDTPEPDQEVEELPARASCH